MQDGPGLGDVPERGDRYGVFLFLGLILAEEEDGRRCVHGHGRYHAQGLVEFALHGVGMLVADGARVPEGLPFDGHIEERGVGWGALRHAYLPEVIQVERTFFHVALQPVGLRGGAFLVHLHQPDEGQRPVEAEGPGESGVKTVKDHAVQRHVAVAAVDRSHVHLQRIPGHSIGLSCGGLQEKPCACGDQLLHLLQFPVAPVPRGQSLNVLVEGHQRFHARGGVLYIVCRDDLVYLRPDPFPLHPSPGRVHAVQQVLHRRVASRGDEELVAGAPRGRYAKALALVLAAALRRDLAIALAQHGVEGADIDPELVVCRGIVAAEVERVPEDAPGLPGLRAPLEMLGVSVGIGRGDEGLTGKYTRSRVVSVACAGILRESRHDHIGPERPDHPDHVTEDLFPVPDAHCLFSTFGKTEIIGPREELFGAVDAPGRQQFLCADHAQRHTLFLADQVLSAVPAGDGEIPRAVLSVPGQPGQQPRVLIVRVGRHVQHTAQHFQFLETQHDVRAVGTGRDLRTACCGRHQ